MRSHMEEKRQKLGVCDLPWLLQSRNLMCLEIFKPQEKLFFNNFE